MSTTAINQQLQVKYDAYVDDLYGQTWDEEVSAPLLMHVFDEYLNMDKKIMIVGQETHGWGGSINGKPSVNSLLKMYEGFALGKSADYNDGKKPRYLKSPFWNFSRSLFHRLNGHIPSVRRGTDGFLWTNISKFDSKTSTPSDELQERNLKGFHLLKDEISITKPDIVIFLTGTKYDGRIASVFGGKVVEVASGVPLHRIKTDNGELPLMTFKTEHPRTLCQHKKYKSEKMYHKVLAEIIATVNAPS